MVRKLFDHAKQCATDQPKTVLKKQSKKQYKQLVIWLKVKLYIKVQSKVKQKIYLDREQKRNFRWYTKSNI